MDSKVEIAQAHKQDFVNNIAHIDELVGSQQGYTTEQLVEILRQRKVYETLAEAMDLLIEKYDVSGAIELVTEEVNDTSSPTLDRNEEATPT